MCFFLAKQYNFRYSCKLNYTKCFNINVFVFILFIFMVLGIVNAGLEDVERCFKDPASLQLPLYKNKTKGQTRCITMESGAPVYKEDITALNEDLLRNRFFLETLAHAVRAKIPERHVHPKGAGAFGYFEVTHNITQYCKAKLFSEIGKKTALVVRFSHGVLEKGEPDTALDVNGFATKFYTEEGNFDIVGFNIPIFTFKEPFLFQPVGVFLRRNPVTNLKDMYMMWDFICNRPETIPFFLYLFGVTGISDGYIHMAGFSIHTYQVYNSKGESYFVRWQMMPEAGVKTLSLEEAAKIASSDPDYFTRQLYNAIANGKYPTYTLGIQVITQKDIDEKPNFDFFDLTKFWPESIYPVKPVGKMVLNKNPKNYFKDVEQAGFCPANFPPGILGAPDNVFLARTLAYKEAQRYRLGTNFDHIPVNRPVVPVYNYDRDGDPPVGYNGGEGPDYLFNSYNGPVPCKEENRPKLITIKQYDDSYNFDQISGVYKDLSNDQRVAMVQVIVSTLNKVCKSLQNRVLDLLGCVDSDLKFRVTVSLSEAAEACSLNS